MANDKMEKISEIPLKCSRSSFTIAKRCRATTSRFAVDSCLGGISDITETVMATNQDILAFLKAEKEERAREKEEEKATRKKERTEDMEQIKSLIKSSVKEEVNAAVGPIQNELKMQGMETNELRQETIELKAKFEEVLKEVEVLKETSKCEHFPKLPSATNLSNLFRARTNPTINQTSGVVTDPNHITKVQELCAGAKKIVGFTPIEPRMLTMQMESYGAKDQAEAMQMEIKSYLKCEMKMLPSEIEKLDIIKIFPPSGQDDWNTLYVEFGSEYQVDKVFQHTKYMRKQDHRVIHWFPREMKERREALEKIAFEIRDADRVNKTRTRIKVGREDLELAVKVPGGRWTRQTLPDDLPSIDLLYSSSQAQSFSPPPGRPGIQDSNLKKRQKSPDLETDGAKKPREKSPGIVEEKEENVEENTILSAVDKGAFTALEAYSPMTPAKTRTIPDMSVIENSPVFHNKLYTKK